MLLGQDDKLYLRHSISDEYEMIMLTYDKVNRTFEILSRMLLYYRSQ